MNYLKYEKWYWTCINPFKSWCHNKNPIVVFTRIGMSLSLSLLRSTYIFDSLLKILVLSHNFVVVYVYINTILTQYKYTF